MKKNLLVLLAACFTSAVANGELLIDDFTIPTLNGALDDGIAGTRTITNNNGATTVVNGAGRVVFSGAVVLRPYIDIVYNFTTPFNMNAVGGGQKTLKLDLFDIVTGEWSVQAFFTNSVGTVADTPRLSVSNPGPRSFSSSLLPTAVASDVKNIRLRLLRLSSAGTITSNGSSVAAVPEPASLALLGITGLGGWFIARRRGRKSETVV